MKIPSYIYIPKECARPDVQLLLMVPQIIFQQNGNNFDMIRSNYIRRGVLALCMFILTMAAWAQHDSDSLKNDFSKHHQQDNYRKNLHGDKFKRIK